MKKDSAAIVIYKLVIYGLAIYGAIHLVRHLL